jgi:hypothetical protein
LRGSFARSLNILLSAATASLFGTRGEHNTILIAPCALGDPMFNLGIDPHTDSNRAGKIKHKNNCIISKEKIKLNL